MADGREVVIKRGEKLTVEARMLRDLGALGAPVPAVRFESDAVVVMDYIANDGSAGPAGERHAAAVLAALHEHTAARYGFEYDTLIGGLPQPNPWDVRWTRFFGEHRLVAMAEVAGTRGRMTRVQVERIARLAARIPELIDEPSTPALIHGDIWSGNVLFHHGRLVGLIDPALYYGDAEVELAFITLFSTFSRTFFDHYQTQRAISDDFWTVKRELYNDYPLLVHAVLFGGGYVAQTLKAVERFE